MHTLTDPRLFLWMTKETVYGILKRNKIAVDVSQMSHSRTYTLEYPEKQWISRRKRKNFETIRKHYFFFY